MPERIDIIVPEEVLSQNDEKARRLDATLHFEATDRTPVIVDMQLWALLLDRGGQFSEMMKSPLDHLRAQILNRKHRWENIHDDQPLDTESLVIELDFSAIRGVEFPMEVVFQGDDQPKTVHQLQSLEDIDSLEIPHPYSGHNKMRIDWYRAMAEMADEFDVRLNGEKLDLQVTLNHAGGPIPSAFALCGSNLFLWMAIDPERIHRLMEIVTNSFLNCVAYLDDLKDISHKHSVWLGADAGELMSSAFFQEFVVPYYNRIWERYPSPRVLHMCGKIDHLVRNIRDEMAIDRLDGFGFPTNRDKLGQLMGGRVVMRGGPHPLLIHDGPVENILAESVDYIQKVGLHGGYMLSEGFGIMPGTPPVHIEAMLDASRKAGRVNERKGK